MLLKIGHLRKIVALRKIIARSSHILTHPPIRFMEQGPYDLWAKNPHTIYEAKFTPIRFMGQKKTGSKAGPVRSVNFS